MAAPDHFDFEKEKLEHLISILIIPAPSLYDHPFHKNFIYSRGITYNPCAMGCGGGVAFLKDIISRPFNFAEQNANRKNCD